DLVVFVLVVGFCVFFELSLLVEFRVTGLLKSTFTLSIFVVLSFAGSSEGLVSLGGAVGVGFVTRGMGWATGVGTTFGSAFGSVFGGAGKTFCCGSGAFASMTGAIGLVMFGFPPPDMAASISLVGIISITGISGTTSRRGRNAGKNTTIPT